MGFRASQRSGNFQRKTALHDAHEDVDECVCMWEQLYTRPISAAK